MNSTNLERYGVRAVVQQAYSIEKQVWLDSREREYLYAFLSSAFRMPPPLNMLEKMLRSGITSGMTAVLKSISHAKAEQVGQALERILFKWKDVLVQQELQLQQEYAFLFLAPNEVSLFESDHLHSQPKHKEIARDMVRITYCIAGQFKRRNLFPADHIAVELDFIADLIGCAARRDNKYPDSTMAQYIFIREHLVRWVPLLCREIAIKGQPGMFYRQMANLTVNLIELDQIILGIRAETKSGLAG